MTPFSSRLVVGDVQGCICFPTKTKTIVLQLCSWASFLAIMSGMLRSKAMKYCSILMPHEVSNQAIQVIGEEGCFHVEDVSSSSSQFTDCVSAIETRRCPYYYSPIKPSAWRQTGPIERRATGQKALGRSCGSFEETRAF